MTEQRSQETSGREPMLRDYIDEAFMWGDQRDYEVMQACRLDREALDSIRDEDGISRAVARRIHHGYMAFGS